MIEEYKLTITIRAHRDWLVTRGYELQQPEAEPELRKFLDLGPDEFVMRTERT